MRSSGGEPSHAFSEIYEVIVILYGDNNIKPSYVNFVGPNGLSSTSDMHTHMGWNDHSDYVLLYPNYCHPRPSNTSSHI